LVQYFTSVASSIAIWLRSGGALLVGAGIEGLGLIVNSRSAINALCAHGKIYRHDDHEQKHDTYRSQKELERRLGNNAFARFVRHGFGTAAEPVCSENSGVQRKIDMSKASKCCAAILEWTVLTRNN
jgi:hypothetical protein